MGSRPTRDRAGTSEWHAPQVSWSWGLEVLAVVLVKWFQSVHAEGLGHLCRFGFTSKDLQDVKHV